MYSDIHLLPYLHHQFFGFLFGAVAWLRNLIIGDNAPLHVIQDSLQLLGYVTLLIKPNCSAVQFLFQPRCYLIELIVFQEWDHSLHHPFAGW